MRGPWVTVAVHDGADGEGAAVDSGKEGISS